MINLLPKNKVQLTNFSLNAPLVVNN